jgi:hypothetical protein
MNYNEFQPDEHQCMHVTVYCSIKGLSHKICMLGRSGRVCCAGQPRCASQEPDAGIVTCFYLFCMEFVYFFKTLIALKVKCFRN